MDPHVAVPRQQLSIGKRITFSKLLEARQKLRRRLPAQQILLKEKVLCGTLDATSFNMGTASLAEPIGGRDAFQTGTGEVIRCVTPVTNDAGSALSAKWGFASRAWCSLKEHLTWSLQSGERGK